MGQNRIRLHARILRWWWQLFAHSPVFEEQWGEGCIARTLYKLRVICRPQLICPASLSETDRAVRAFAKPHPKAEHACADEAAVSSYSSSLASRVEDEHWVIRRTSAQTCVLSQDMYQCHSITLWETRGGQWKNLAAASGRELIKNHLGDDC